MKINDIEKNGLLKFKLFLQGVNISSEQLKMLHDGGYRVPAIVRAGASYGIETNINNSLPVNIPLNPNSSISLSNDFTSLNENGKYLCAVSVLKSPYSYNFVERDGQVISNVAKICFDRLGITVNSGCYFKEQRKGCHFCGITYSSHYNRKKVLNETDVMCILENAFEKLGRNKIRHLLLSGGAFPSPDYGTDQFSKIAKRVKEKYSDLSIYIMMPAPESNENLQRLIDSGIDEIGLNIELINESYRKQIPGKEEIGLKRYLESLEYLSKRMKPFGARSILMAGIEPTEFTLKGIDLISSVGAMPILSYYRPIGDQTDKVVFKSEQEIYQLWANADKIARTNGTVIGPTCIPCQNNVIALPNTEAHYYY